jgi:hypothetical protein
MPSCWERFKEDATSGKCSVYAQWLNILSLPLLAVSLLLALLPLSFSPFIAITASTVLVTLTAVEWPSRWTPALVDSLAVVKVVRQPAVKAGVGAVAGGVLVVGTVGAWGGAGKAASGAVLLIGVGALLNALAAIRREESEERYGMLSLTSVAS